MIHEILPVGPLRCNCSIIGDETTREAMVIDPGDDIEDVLTLIRKHNLQVKQIVITHAHIDHVGGAMKLRAATGAPILLNQNDYALLKMLDVQAAWIGMRYGDTGVGGSFAAPAQASCGVTNGAAPPMARSRAKSRRFITPPTQWPFGRSVRRGGRAKSRPPDLLAQLPRT